MRKIVMFMVIGLLAVLTGCTEPVEVPTGCQEGETQIGEECLVLTGPELQLYNAINFTERIVGYDLDVEIANETESVDLNIEVDLNTTSIAIGTDRVITYTDTGDTCDVLEVYRGVESTYSLDCTESEQYTFFKDFDYTWFALESGKYALQEEFYEDVEGLFGGYMENAKIINFTTSVQEGYISEIIMLIEINEMEYSVEMMVSDITIISLTQTTGGDE